MELSWDVLEATANHLSPSADLFPTRGDDSSESLLPVSESYTFAASPLDRFREDVVDYGFEFTLMATVDLFYEIDELLPFGSRA